MKNGSQRKRLLELIAGSETRSQVNFRVTPDFSRQLAALAFVGSFSESHEIKTSIEERCERVFGTSDIEKITEILQTKI